MSTRHLFIRLGDLLVFEGHFITPSNIPLLRLYNTTCDVIFPSR